MPAAEPTDPRSIIDRCRSFFALHPSLFIFQSLLSHDHSLTMTEAQAEINAGRFLNDFDCNISFELGQIADGAHDIRKKFLTLSDQAQELKTQLLDEQKNQHLLTAQHQQQLSKSLKSSETLRNKLRQLGDKLRQSRAENRSLRKQVQTLGSSLEKARQKLNTVEFLQCSICWGRFKDVMIPCGHCFCRSCLKFWLGNSRISCPICRQSFAEIDIRALYLELGSGTAGDDEGEDDVVSLVSDNE